MMYAIIGLLIILLFVNILSLLKQKNIGTMYVSRRTSEEENVQIGFNVDPSKGEGDLVKLIELAGNACEKRLKFHNDRKIKMYDESKKEAEERARLKKEGKLVNIKGEDEAS